MKALNLIYILCTLALFTSCGQESSTDGYKSNYDQFITSHDGVEVKEPNKLNLMQGQINPNQQVLKNDIVISLDSNGTYHLRSKIPASLGNNNVELEGIKGEWSVDSRGLLQLEENGIVIAESNYLVGSGNITNSINLEFIRPVDIEVLSLDNLNGYNGGYGYPSFDTYSFSLNGYATVTR